MDSPVARMTVDPPSILVSQISLRTRKSIRDLIVDARLLHLEADITASLLQQFGWMPDHKIRLAGVTLTPFSWEYPRDPSEPRTHLCERGYKPATMYEWLCFAATQPHQMKRILRVGDVAAFSGSSHILLKGMERRTAFYSHSRFYAGIRLQ